MDLQHADIHDALRLLAAVGEVNIIANHEVQGTITARLQQVPWEQALAVILQMTGLSQERQGNVILVAPGSFLRRAEAERQQARQAALAAEPVITRVIPVHYTDAAALATIIEQWLGRCAMLSVHQHTNTLVLTGTPACLRLLPTSVFSKAGSPP